MRLIDPGPQSIAGDAWLPPASIKLSSDASFAFKTRSFGHSLHSNPFLGSTMSNSLLVIALLAHTIAAVFTTADSLASSYSLTTSFTPPFPSSNLSSNAAADFIISKWGPSKGAIQHSPQDISFVPDPFPSSQIPSDTSVGKNASNGPVLKVTYSANQFSATSSGTQFLSLFNGSQPFQSMLLTYDVAFDQNFDWVKGGKLPGIRGGKHANGCFGGNLPNGTDCFSVRLDWRPQGKGQVNTFIPNPGSFCNSTGVHCTAGAGIDIAPDAVSFQSNGWNRISILVRLNDPPTESNGVFAVFYNDVPALTQNDLQYRTTNEVNATGFVFSTFFGGSDSSFAPTTEQHAFFRNIQMWGGSSGSNVTSTTGPQSGPHPATGGGVGLHSRGAGLKSLIWISVAAVGSALSF